MENNASRGEYSHFDQDVDGVASFEASVMDSLMARSIQTGQTPPGSGFAPWETDTASHAEGFSPESGVHIHASFQKHSERQGLEHLLSYGNGAPRDRRPGFSTLCSEIGVRMQRQLS